MKKTLIVSAFPACGKSYIYNNQDKYNINVLDSDSSQFSWVKDEYGNNTKTRNPSFPQNYIEHIKANIGKVDIIFISSHDIVRKALKENNIKYILVYPHRDLKFEWLDRCVNRGNDTSFVAMIESNWDKFIDSIENEKLHNVIILKSREYLSDVVLCRLYKEPCSVKETFADEYKGTDCCYCTQKTNGCYMVNFK